jgi:hypothetical protein
MGDQLIVGDPIRVRKKGLRGEGGSWGTGILENSYRWGCQSLDFGIGIMGTAVPTGSQRADPGT